VFFAVKKFSFCFARQKNLSLCRFPKSFILLQNGGLLARKSFSVMRHKIDLFFCGVRGKIFGIFLCERGLFHIRVLKKIVERS